MCLNLTIKTVIFIYIQYDTQPNNSIHYCGAVFHILIRSTWSLFRFLKSQYAEYDVWFIPLSQEYKVLLMSHILEDGARNRFLL